MQCPHCNINFHPQFFKSNALYDTKSRVHEIHSQLCPNCQDLIIGVYVYKFGQGKIVTTDNAEKLLKLVVPMELGSEL